MDDVELARFRAKTRRDKTSGCVLWTATRNRQGYGLLHASLDGGPRKMRSAHRLAWEHAHGPIPSGLCVCHKCDTPSCVNPDHLFLGTYRDNKQDMIAKGRDTNAAALNRAKTHCIRGHEFTPENTREWHGHRICRRCHAARNAALGRAKSRARRTHVDPL